MPYDALITRDGPVNAPLDYNIPNQAVVIPGEISATFADPTNAGPYVPCVEFVTAAGQIIGPFPLSQSIAAGASARVSWFRGVVAAEGGQLSNPGLMAARVNIVGSINVPEGDPGTFVTWGEAVVDTGTPSPFWNPATPLRLTAPVNGIYMDLVNLEWSTLALASQPGYVAVYLYKNGAASPAYFYDVNTAEPQGGSGPPYNLTGVTHGIFPMNAGDYWEILAYNNNAGGVARQLIDLRPTENHYSSFSMILVGTT